MKVLVADDSAVMRKVLVRSLAMIGVTDVTEATDGQEALDAAIAADYDIILMDWNMPALLGIDALRGIRAKGKATPVVMVTTEAEMDRIRDAVKAGATGYILKPFDPATIGDKLLAIVKKLPKA